MPPNDFRELRERARRVPTRERIPLARARQRPQSQHRHDWTGLGFGQFDQRISVCVHGRDSAWGERLPVIKGRCTASLWALAALLAFAPPVLAETKSDSAVDKQSEPKRVDSKK